MVRAYTFDYLITFFAYAVTIVLNLIFYFYLPRLYGSSGMEEFLLIRRVFALVSVVSMLGVAVVLPREISRRIEASEISIIFNLTIAGLVISWSVLSVFAILVFFFTSQISIVFFGNDKYTYLFPYIVMLMYASSFNSIIFSVLRGKQDVLLANSLTIITSIIPILLFLFCKNIPSMMAFQTLLIFITTTIFAIKIFMVRDIFINVGLDNFWAEIKELLKFGVPRVPGDIAYESIFAAPVFFSAHLFGTTNASYLAFGITILSIFGSAFAPFSLILLPLVASKLRDREFSSIVIHVSRILKLVVPIVMVLSLLSFYLAKYIAYFFLDSMSEPAVIYLRVFVIALFPFTLYTLLRSVNDAIYSKAVNSMNCTISFIVFCVLLFGFYFSNFGETSIMIAIVGAHATLGGLTYWRYRRGVSKLIIENADRL